MTLAPSCETCAFWNQDGPQDGTCRRSAPRPTEAADQIAHWPMTDGQERCGEGIMRDQAPALVSCGECRFWRTNPGGGLDPQNRRDARRDWWKTAGHCVRHAPHHLPIRAVVASGVPPVSKIVVPKANLYRDEMYLYSALLASENFIQRELGGGARMTLFLIRFGRHRCRPLVATPQRLSMNNGGRLKINIGERNE